MKVVEINKDLGIGVAEVSGFKREVRMDLLDDVKIGDYVIVHAGFAIQRLNPEEALETLKLIEEAFGEEFSEF